MKIQGIDQIVDISDWERDEESGEVFPEGSKEKTLYRAPDRQIYKFIIPDHRYLFKLSSNRYPEQFWAEIIAYKIGLLIGVDVPPTFAAVNKENNKTGALIEWFFNYPDTITELKVSGLSYMQLLIKDYDSEKGKQHNFQSIKILHSALARKFKWEMDWLKHWVATLTFDTLIGNTDRHQDNWGIIWLYKDNKAFPLRMTPVFDNGTGMGHEILKDKFERFNEDEKISRYVAKGCHHMKWSLYDQKRYSQIEFLEKLIGEYPDKKSVVAKLMKFDTKALEDDIMKLTEFNIPCPLSSERARFIIRLLMFRRERILSMLGD